MSIRKSSYLLFISFFVCFLFLTPTTKLKAELCTIDEVPAATLLIPHFEVAIAKNCNKTRLSQQISITNINAAAIMARVVIWTEWSVPVYGFTVYLTGYQATSFDLADIVCSGKGIGVSAPDEPNPDVANDRLDLMQAWLTGKPSPASGRCASPQRDSNIARGYITVDHIISETDGFPSDGLSYMSALSNVNVLVGDYYVIDKRVGGARKVCGRDRNCKRRYKAAVLNARGLHGAPAVAIEAQDNAFSAGQRTFYGRYINSLASDQREPLPEIWHVRYNQTKVAKKFDMIVWREGNSSASSVDCDSEPSYHPMSMTQIVAFDENSTPESLDEENAPLGTLQFPNETQVIKSAVGNLPFQNGWIYLNFKTLFSSDNAYSSEVGSSYVITRRDGVIDSAGVHPLASGCSSN